MKRLYILLLLVLIATPSFAQRYTRGSGGGGGSLAIGSGVTGGTATRVLYIDGSSLLADDADLTFDGSILTSRGGLTVGDNTDQSFTVFTVDLLTADQTIQWDDVNNEWDFSAPINASGTGQSALGQGLVVNNDAGSTEDDDFLVKGDTISLIDCDAGDETCTHIATLFSGKVDYDAGAVNDDDCTGEQGLMWYDDTDSAFEFCNANSGTPSVLGGSGFVLTTGDTMTGQLDIDAPAVSGRETAFQVTVDDASDLFFVGNGTASDTVFAPVFGGFTTANNLWGLGFMGFAEAADDASDSSAYGMLDFAAFRTTDTSDPLNGTLSDIANRKLFTWRSYSSVLMTMAANGNLGLGVTPTQNLHIYKSAGNVRSYLQQTGAGNYSANTYMVTDDSNLLIGAADDSYSDIGEVAGKTFLQGDGGNMAILAKGGDLEIYAGGVAATDKRMVLDSAGGLLMLEQADASADVAGYGQIWVNTATPNELWFTNDAGTDVQLGTGGGGSSTGFLDLQVQQAKVSGSYITNASQIDAGDGNWRLLMDASQTESGLWQFRMPSTYSSAPVAKLLYSMASATTGKVDLEVDVMAVADGEDPNSASFDTTNEITGGTTVPGTAGHQDSISITLTNNDSIAAGELAIIRINRDHDDADDTATGDLELIGVTIEWTE